MKREKFEYIEKKLMAVFLSKAFYLKCTTIKQQKALILYIYPSDVLFSRAYWQ
jgi:hypothetical protein